MTKVLTSLLALTLGAVVMFGVIEVGAHASADRPVQIAQASPGSGSDVPHGPVTIEPAAAGPGSAAQPAPATTPAPAATVPDPGTDAEGFLKALLDAATTGKWKVFAGLVLVALVYVTRRWVLGKVAWFQTKIGGIALALGMSLGGTLGLALASGSAITLAVLLNALSTAVAAAGLWQWLQNATAPRRA